MADLPRLNGVVRALEHGGTAFVTFCEPDVNAVQSINRMPYDGVVLEAEHNPYDIRVLRDCLQYMLDRRQILTAGTIAPTVTPLVRIPPNGSEMNQWLVKQVLDIGAYGIVFPHVDSVDEARNAVAACRYSRPPSSARYHPAGLRGDGPRHAAQYWGVTTAQYYERADVWPLDPNGEILVVIMCESALGVKNLPSILDQVPGIGAVLIGEGDLSQDLGYPRQYGHSAVVEAIDEIVAVCKRYNVACGHPHVGVENVAQVVSKGFRWLMPSPTMSHAALDNGLKLTGRA